MYFGEDKQKVQKIVQNQVPYFRSVYADHVKSMPLLHWNPNQNIIEVFILFFLYQECSLMLQ